MRFLRALDRLVTSDLTHIEAVVYRFMIAALLAYLAGGLLAKHLP